MKRLTLRANQIRIESLGGAVLCRDLYLETDDGRTTLRRGASIDEVTVRLPADASALELHLLVPDAGDMTQEDASEQVATAIAGHHVSPTAPHQGQVDLEASAFGLLRIDSTRVRELNQSGIVLIATALEGRVVEAGETVAIVKASELLVPDESVQDLVNQSGDAPVVEIAPFTRARVGLIAGERIREANLKVSSRHLAASLERFGAMLVEVRRSADEPDSIAAHYQEMIGNGVELILVAGSIVLDPEDAYLQAIEHADGRLVRRGAPIDPGTMFWVAYLPGETPVFGLASCEMYGRLSIIDLFLPYALADVPITSELMSRLGYGGLLSDTQIARQPLSWRSLKGD